jgi:hypothetical protein
VLHSLLLIFEGQPTWAVSLDPIRACPYSQLTLASHLMKQCRTCQRTFDDDKYQFCLEDGSVLASVFDANATLALNGSPDLEVNLDFDDLHTKRIRVSVVKNKPTKKPRTENFIDDPVVAIWINQQFEHCKTGDELYQCTRGLWRMSKTRASRAKYAFAVYKGAIKEVLKSITGSTARRHVAISGSIESTNRAAGSFTQGNTPAVLSSSAKSRQSMFVESTSAEPFRLDTRRIRSCI